MIGSRLGPYDVIASLGAGGMGEVYRARDRRLERDVAIKILSPQLSSNPQFRERFEREAKAISQLNHPNICTLHDVGHEDGTSYLVMELLEGESLAERLEKGPLPLEQVLRYGVQIADALDKAHRQGIVHRDLKPGNVMITKSGAKLLDFGLAKTEASGLGPRGSILETEHRPLTEEGTILGTFQYMAPEQLEGEEADARTDIFSFGVVLYEMATGRRAFEGKTRTSLIAAIVASDPPPMSRVQPLTPPALEHVVRKCLAKDRDDRWQSAHDIAEELRWIAEAGSGAGVTSPLTARRRVREGILLATAIVACIAAASLGLLLWRGRAVAPRVLRANIVGPPGNQFSYARIDSAALTLSPDGRYITFAAIDGSGKTRLWVRALDAEQAQPLAGSEDGQAPFWSPDSKSIAFFADRKLKRIDVRGGPAVTICDASDGRGGAWNREGVIIFEPTWRAPIYRVSADGGRATQVTKIDEKAGETTHRWPWFLPDGRHFLYMAATHRNSKSEINAVYLGSLDSNEKKLVLRARSNVIYMPGYLLFARDTWLMAQPFDVRTLSANGDPIRIADNVTYDSTTFRGAFAASDQGTLAYYTGSATPEGQLWWYDRTGHPLSKIGEPLPTLQADVFQTLRLSPDETKLALDIGDTADIWIFDLKRDTRTRFTSDPMNDASPVWSPDGRKIVYYSDRDAVLALYEKPVDGLTRERLVAEVPQRFLIPTSWSADGKYIAVEASEVAALDSTDIWILPLGGDGKLQPFIATEFRDVAPAFSPDGRWLTYMSNETGRLELYAVSFPSRAEKRQLTNGGLMRYTWRRDGREIIYMASDRTVMSISVDVDKFSTPTTLFKSEVPLIVGDVTRDGSRFIAAAAERTEVAPITLVTNWKVTKP